YIGAASGTTASHVADIVDRGQVYCVEFSPRSFRDLVEITRDRPHMIPILADARKPEGYGAIVGEADILYQDVSQRDQLDIFLKNAALLSPKGSGFLMLKARSIDSSANPKKLYEDAVRTLAKEGYALESMIELDPMQKDHAAIVVSRRK
ncbi:MAG: fibrillarin-like rRNA/tRNA 2'-O-methyltransferase, partial [Candidatus Thermoplasmatota archaeon]|nr:fibrillarin-like rRNA/tRNA 2'-O-methyltransferase [Candidatus Thermoplasmatota archaeon]